MTREEFSLLLRSFLEKHDRFIIAGHEGPDGDCIGSAVALGLAIRNMGKEAYIFYDSDGPIVKEAEVSDLLPPVSLEEARKIAAEAPYAFLMVDCSEDKRLGDGSFLPEQAIDFLCIDHHKQSETPKRLTYVEDHTIATCEILYYLLTIAKIPITREMAGALYLGLATDSGGFRHPGTSEDTYKAAAALIELGADPTRTLNRQFHTHAFKEYKVMAAVFKKMKLYEGGIVMAAMTRGDLAKIGASPEEASGMVSHLAEVEEAQVAIYLRELEDEKINCSLRSRDDTDVSKVARSFGGGGHIHAAGCTICEPLLLAKKLVLEAVRAEMKNAGPEV